MNDMPPIDHTSDPRAAFKDASRRELAGILGALNPPPPADDLATVQARVVDLDAKLKGAWQQHYRLHPGGRTSNEQRASLASVQAIEFALKEARERAAQLENAALAAELRAAREAAPEASFLFQVEAPDGRKFDAQAKDAATLQRSMQAGYRVVGRVYPGYVAPIDPAAGNCFLRFCGASRSLARLA